jgi:hypothetical protein
MSIVRYSFLFVVFAASVWQQALLQRASAAPPRSKGVVGPRTIQSDGVALAAVRTQLQAGDSELEAAARAVCADANKQLKLEPITIVTKPWSPPSGDKHDYMSLAPYFWPDPKQPGGIPYQRKDGQTNPQRDEFDEPKLVQLCRAVRDLGIGYYLTGNDAYAAQATMLVRTWFLNPETRMNPNANFGQFVPGVTNGRAEGVLETRGLMNVLDAVALLAESPAWSKADQQGLEKWFREYLQWLMQSPIGQEEAQAENNHGSWWNAQAATFALFVGDEKTAKQIVTLTAQNRIAKQILPDGSQPLETSRTKGFDYCLFNLEALIAVATVGDRLDVDIWNYQSPQGASMRAAIDWLLPFAVGEKPWPYDQIKKPKTSHLYQLLRRAAIAYHEPQYEALVGKFHDSDSEAEMVDLLYPKLSIVPAAKAGGSTGVKKRPSKSTKSAKTSKPSGS